MKLKIAMAFLLLVISVRGSDACEICGCGNNNFQIGILPNFKNGFMGIRYSSSRYQSRSAIDPTQYSRDLYNSIELWGGYQFRKFQIMGFVPYSFNTKVSDDGTVRSNGMGDVLLLTNYKLLSSMWLNKSETASFRQELMAGVGIKLPTGINRVDPGSPDFNVGDFNSQAGTGSVDYLLNATHNLMWNRNGIVTNAAYRINSTNRQGYRFGSRTYFNTAYYYTFTFSNLKLKPSAGINYQANAVNTYAGAAVDGSNGYNLNGTLGLNLIYGKLGINAMAFLPVKQDLYHGQTKLLSRAIIGLTYSF